ncbi:glycosyltransferase [Photobacterium sanguinicancri]|uniref:glycosyltransferase n=1 Tax=Photobacterium sanguinicancri TaxID=875932 RepID=UPI0026E2097E|nr:glycosyltransferase [Photobacterium sanguinicancri]MDO6499529.1 glycosyltransferase [Photobacterium sanguinicancri]
MRNKKITLLVGSLAGGGAEGVCVSLANGFSDAGYDVTLLVLNLNNAINQSRVSESVTLVNLDVSNVRYAFFTLRSYIKSNKIKQILVFDHLLSVLLVAIRYSLKSKFQIVSRNINTITKELNSYSSFWYKVIVKKLVISFYKKVDFIINQSKGMMDDLLDFYPEFNGRTIYIHNPVNEKISNAIVDTTTCAKKDYFLCVGRLESQKAFHHAITSFSEFLVKHPHFQLKIVGIGELEESLKSLCASLNISDSVDFEGFQSDILPYYIGAKATLLTSKYEGFPNVLVESISLGTPVVSFNCPSGPSEIIKNGVNGFLVENLDVNEFTNSLEKIYNENLPKEKVIETANVYHLDNVIKKYIEVIESIK